MRPGLIFSGSSRRSPLLTVIEECGVPPCLPLLSPDPGSLGNNSSVMNEAAAKALRLEVPTSNNAAPGKKTAQHFATKEMVRGGAKALAKEAKGKVAAKDTKNAVNSKDVAKDGSEPDLGMGMAAVANEASAEGPSVDVKDAGHSEVVVEVTDSTKASNDEKGIEENALNVVTDEVESDGAQNQQSEDTKVAENGGKFVKGKSAPGKDGKMKAAVMKDAGKAGKGAVMKLPVKSAGYGKTDAQATKGATDKSAPMTNGDTRGKRHPAMTKGADDGKKDAKNGSTVMKDAGKGAKDVSIELAAVPDVGNGNKDAQKDSATAKEAGKAVQDAKFNSALTKQVGKGNRDVKQAFSAMKQGAKDAAKFSTKVNDPGDSGKDGKMHSTDFKAAEQGTKDAKEDSAAVVEGAATGPEERTAESLPAVKNAAKSSKDVKGKSASAPNESGKSAKGAKSDAHVTKGGAMATGKDAAKNAAKNTKMMRLNQTSDAAESDGAMNHATDGVTATSNTQAVLPTSSETETFDAASSDSVEPMVAAAARRLAVRQATGESADFGHFANADIAHRPPVDGMGEKAAPGVSLDSPPSSGSRQQQVRSLEEPIGEIDPGSALDRMHLVTTASSSEESQSALSSSLAVDARDRSSQASTTETVTSELEEVFSQSSKQQEQQQQEQQQQKQQQQEQQQQQHRVVDIARLEQIKAEAAAAVRRFFSKKSSAAISASGAAHELSDAMVRESSTLSMQQMQHQSQQAQQQIQSTSCPMHVQISEKAIELFELLETALSQRRRKHRQRSSSKSVQNAANSAGSAASAAASAGTAAAAAAAAEGSLHVQRHQRCRRRRRHCDDNQDDVSLSAASATLSEAILQEVEFEEVTQEEEEEEGASSATATNRPVTARRSNQMKQSGRNQATSMMPQSVMKAMRRHFRA